MFIRNGKRIDPFRPHEIDGVRYPHLRDVQLREQLGITEIPDPTPPEDFSDDTYYVTHQDEAPYVIWTRKSDEQIAKAAQSKLNMVSEAYLRDTDWMVIRAMENPAKPLPADVAQKRAEARNNIVHEVIV